MPDADLDRLAGAAPSRAARWVAGALTPSVVVLALAAYLAWRHAPTAGGAVRGWLVVALLVVGLPYAVLGHGLRSGRIGDRQVVRRGQRPWLMGWAAVSAAAALALLWWLGPRELAAVVSGVLAGLVVVAVLSARWKVSVHVASYAGALAVLALDSPPVAVGALAGLPLVAWARVRSGRHSIGETAAGAVIGAVVSGTAYALLR